MADSTQPTGDIPSVSAESRLSSEIITEPAAGLVPGPEVERYFAISLMEQLVVPIFVLNARGEVIIWNRACERLTAVPASEVVGTTQHWRAFYDAPRPTLADLICQGRTGEALSLYDQYEIGPEARDGLTAENWCDMPRAGRRLYLAIDAGSVYDREGKLIAVVESVRDMTVQKRAQIALQQLATRDSLTGLANRRSFDESLRTEWRRTMRESKSIVLLMIDVDQFKAYNDRFGHLAGDALLKRLADSLQTEIRRAGDVVARYGGEEFAVILPNQTLEGGAVVAERMRARVEAMGHEEGHKVSISVGVSAAMDCIAPEPDGLVATADIALYDAKNAGRNRVMARQVDESVL